MALKGLSSPWNELWGNLGGFFCPPHCTKYVLPAEPSRSSCSVYEHGVGLRKDWCFNGLDVSFVKIRMFRDPALCISVSQSFVSPLTNEQMLVIVSSATCQGEASFSVSQNFCDLFAVLFLPHCFCSISVALKQCVISVLWNRSLCCNQSAKLEVDNYCCKWQKIE